MALSTLTWAAVLVTGLGGCRHGLVTKRLRFYLSRERKGRAQDRRGQASDGFIGTASVRDWRGNDIPAPNHFLIREKFPKPFSPPSFRPKPKSPHQKLARVLDLS